MTECAGSVFLTNGKVEEVQHFDASFLKQPHYIYEVFRVIDGVALFLEDHLSRLQETCRLSAHCHGFEERELHEQVYRLIHENHLGTGNIKIVLRKRSDNRSELLLYVSPHDYPTPEQYTGGVDVSLFRAIRQNPNAKVMDVALRNATNAMKVQKDVYETLLVDTEGCITEGSRSNVFFIRDGKVITPPLEDVLPGITRMHIMDVCTDLHLTVCEERVPARSLVVMEALFISGTSRKVLPVKKVDELEFDPRHPLLDKIRKGFEQKVSGYIRLRKNA